MPSAHGSSPLPAELKKRGEGRSGWEPRKAAMSPVDSISLLADTSKVAFLERIQFALISFYSQLGLSGHESAVKVSGPPDETDRRGAVLPSRLLTRNITLAMLRKSTEDKIKTQSSLGSKAGPIFAFCASFVISALA